jgi:hypothetical protein
MINEKKIIYQFNYINSPVTKTVSPLFICPTSSNEIDAVNPLTNNGNIAGVTAGTGNTRRARTFIYSANAPYSTSSSTKTVK